MLRTHRAGKGLGGCGGGWGLGSRNRRGPGVAPPLVSEGGGPHLGAQQAFLSSSGQGKRPPLLCCSSGPAGPLPPAFPVLPSASLLCPQGPTRPGGGFGEQGTGLGAQQAPCTRVGGSVALCSSRLRLLISPASGVPVLSGLHCSSLLFPARPTGSLGGSLPSPWASGSPTSSQQVP